VFKSRGTCTGTPTKSFIVENDKSDSLDHYVLIIKFYIKKKKAVKALFADQSSYTVILMYSNPVAYSRVIVCYIVIITSHWLARG